MKSKVNYLFVQQIQPENNEPTISTLIAIHFYIKSNLSYKGNCNNTIIYKLDTGINNKNLINMGKQHFVWNECRHNDNKK